MRDYELVLVLRPDAEEEQVRRTVERIHGVISGGGGEISSVDDWGRRKLAYPIERHLEGIYSLTHLRMEPEHATGLEGAIRLSEDIMRHLLVRKDEP